MAVTVNYLYEMHCDACGYVYGEALGNPENGMEPGTPWDELPEDFVCPLCGVGKDMFTEE